MMNWKFWKRKESGGAEGKRSRLPGPKELPQSVGRELVIAQKEDPDWVWSLKGVWRPSESGNGFFEIRIFNPADAKDKGIAVRDFDFLDDYPELVLYSGVYDKSGPQVRLNRS